MSQATNDPALERNRRKRASLACGAFLAMLAGRAGLHSRNLLIFDSKIPYRADALQFLW
jgi:hypothetical protein